MSYVLRAIIWKNLLLRRNHYMETLRELFLPLILLLLVNLYLQPTKLNTSDRSELLSDTYIQPNPDSILLYSPDNEDTRSFVLQFGKNAGFKPINIQPKNFGNDTGEFTFGFLLHEKSDSFLNYVIYPGLGTWPESLPIWHTTTNRLIGQKLLLLMQNFIDSGLKNSTGELMPQISLRKMGNNDDIDIFGLLVFLALIFAISFLVPPVITRVVEEKESGAKELMRMMGVTRCHLWTGKVIDVLLVVFVVGVGIVVLLTFPIKENSIVLQHVHPLYFFLFFMIGMLAVSVCLFALSCLFENATYAGIVAGSIIAGSFMIVMTSDLTPMSWASKIIYCFMPPMTLFFSFQYLLKLEFLNKPVHWTERLSLDDSGLTLSELLFMMILDILIYSVLTWYLDNVNPGQYGVSQPKFFFLTKSYWCPSITVDYDDAKGEAKSSDYGVSVTQLKKVYHVSGRPALAAVDGVDLDIPKGSIYALLGHNGAGKSTTMNIITGLIPATSGTVLINGYNIRLNPDAARRSIGLCPQKDLLFRDLTTMQTLQFYGMIKGLSAGDAFDEAKELLKTMKMSHVEKKNTQSLSGGMKRKLSLAIAIIGDSKVLILDEPTAGVDPELRREICDLLLSYRGVRTILLTTHIMEEADAICDYIYIMDHGKVQCSGTSLDLKARFGTGYTLQIVIQHTEEQTLINTVVSTVFGSRFKTRNAATLVFQLPSIEAPSFPDLFFRLDQMQANDEIVSYSVSISTLEDVFIGIRELNKDGQRQNSDQVDGTPYRALGSNTEFDKYEGCCLIMRQIYAQLIKKYLVFIRCYRRFLFFFFIPILLICISKFIFPKLTKMEDKKTSELTFIDYSSSMYSGMTIFYSKSNCSFCESYVKSLQKVTKKRGFKFTEVANVSEAVHKEFEADYHRFRRYLALGFEISSENIIIHYNKEAVHIGNVGLNILNTAWLDQSGPFDIKAATNLTLVEKRQVSEFNQGVTTDTNFPDYIGLQTLCYMAALQSEKIHGAKPLQLLAISAWVYWLANIIFDFGTFSVFASVASGIYYALEPDDLVFQKGYYFVAAVLFWGAGLILISYIICYLTQTHASSISVALLIYFTFSFFMWPLVSASVVPLWVRYIHPTMTWKIGLTEPDNTYLLILLAYAVVLFIFVVLMESAFIKRISHKLLTIIRNVNYSVPDQTDSDVIKEAELVSELIEDLTEVPNTLLASKLKRMYGFFRPHAAVKGVSFRVVPGECFGLLGVNGAGKSSTFNMLTGQISCSEGDVYLNESYISAYNRDNYLSQVGYCPQASGIIPELTGKEFLQLFCRLRGYREDAIDETTETWIKILDLEECAGKQCGRYSGGMERKLSAAAAFLWDANIVMLDEPTSGVDPVARRSIWKAVTTAQGNGKGVLLTSHSMDECDALCSRLAIMVDGHFKCFGETTTIKKKYGGGYSIQLKLSKASPEDIADFQHHVEKSFHHGCRLTDVNSSILHYHVSDERINWMKLFRTLEKLKYKYPIFESYMASETTLEQIFLAFASTREPPVRVPVTDIS